MTEKEYPSDRVAWQACTVVLQQIARGREDNGRPMASEKARQLARKTLMEFDISWPGQRQSGARWLA